MANKEEPAAVVEKVEVGGEGEATEEAKEEAVTALEVKAVEDPHLQNGETQGEQGENGQLNIQKVCIFYHPRKRVKKGKEGM